MVQAPKWTDDIEREVAAYQSAMTPLAKILSRLSNRAIDALKADVAALLQRGNYRGQDAVVLLNGYADSGTVKRITDLLGKIPEQMRAKMWKAVTEQVAEHRMTNRLAIRTLAKLNCYAVMDEMRDSTARILTTTAREGYLRGTFILQREAGHPWYTDGIGGRVQVIVDSHVRVSDAKRFMDPLADMSSKVVIDSLLRGLPPDEVSKSVDDVKGAQIYRSKREARTTLTSVSQEGHHEAYVECGVRQYYFRCTYDERTCRVCGGMDGRRIDVYKAKAGYNYPPMHPNCRCTTVAAFSKEVEAVMAKRYVKDRTTGELHVVPQDYSYRQWYATYGPGRTDGIAYTPKRRSR